MTQLRAIAGFAQFVDRLSQSVADLAFALVGENEDQVQEVLGETRANLTRQLANVVGVKTATWVAEGFIDAVRCRRAEIEADGGMPRELN